MSLDTSLLWSQEQLWKEVLCSSENSECNKEHICLQAMSRRMSMWLSSTVCCDIWPSSGTGNCLNVVIHINEFSRLNSSVSGLCFWSQGCFYVLFFVLIGNINTPGPILHLAVIIIKGKLSQICVQASTLLSLRHEGRRETMSLISFIFSPRSSQQ